ncbi:MAG: hypothetical protein H8Z69_02945 [Nanohaloarchaea archaeon]|nr:hypothetical protein [Candidatus Nanohaloarchaea archaeon]
MAAEVETISTSTTKLLVGLAGILMLSGAVSGYYYGDGSGSSLSTGNAEFSIPQYNSQGEILTKLVAPFLLVFIIFYLGLFKALWFAYADDDGPFLTKNKKEEKKQVRKYATIISILISAMIIPSPLFHALNDFTAIVFGGLTYILLGALGFAFLLVLWSIFS